MRIVADIHIADPSRQERALAWVLKAFVGHGLIECEGGKESSDVVNQLIHDMTEGDRTTFLDTLRIVAKHTVDGTVAAINLPRGGSHIIVRLRNPRLDRLMPRGTDLLHDILSTNAAEDNCGMILHFCEIRERGNSEGFMFGTWSPGVTNPLRYMYSQRGFFNICIMALFIIGFLLEVILTLADLHNKYAELGLRLGAPMLVSSSVLLLERWAYWLRERTPRLRWVPARSSGSGSPSRADHGFDN